MQILHLSHGYPPALGGSEILFAEMSERLRVRHGHDVTVVTSTGYTTAAFRELGQPLMAPGEEERGGVRVRRHVADPRLAPRLRVWQARAHRRRLPLNGVLRTLYDGPLAPGMLRDACTLDADVIGATAFPLLHMHFAVAAGRARRIPVALWGAIHPEDRWGYDRGVIRAAVRAADAYVANTTYERDHVLRWGVDPERVHVIGPGVDPDELAGGDGASARERLGIPLDVPLVGFLGQLGGHKGIDDLVLAMQHVWRFEPDAWLVLAGGYTPFVEHVREVVMPEIDPSDRARIKLVVDVPAADKRDLLAAFDVFASPSGFESFGITYVEAWAAGKPVIGCNLGAVPTVVSHGEDGLLIGYRSQHELAAAIVELLGDRAFAGQLAAAGHRKALELHTWDRSADLLDALYRQLAEAA
jgi:glycosyltransferase involved in cell wall biosynthesis